MENRAIRTVLLVDDTVEIRYLLRMLLANVASCQVVAEAENGSHAKDLAQRLRPDVVILDMSMPVMDGPAALPRILAASPETKVLMYSLRTDVKERSCVSVRSPISRKAATRRTSCARSRTRDAELTRG